MAADNVVVEPGDMLLIHTGFATKVLEWNRDPDPVEIHRMCTYLDAHDDALLEWIAESQISALVADNYAVEGLVGREARRGPAFAAADPPPLPVQARRSARRDVVPARARDLAARAQPQPLPAHRAPAAAARRRRLPAHPDRDGLRVDQGARRIVDYARSNTLPPVRDRPARARRAGTRRCGHRATGLLDADRASARFDARSSDPCHRDRDRSRRIASSSTRRSSAFFGVQTRRRRPALQAKSRRDRGPEILTHRGVPGRVRRTAILLAEHCATYQLDITRHVPSTAGSGFGAADDPPRRAGVGSIAAEPRIPRCKSRRSSAHRRLHRRQRRCTMRRRRKAPLAASIAWPHPTSSSCAEDDAPVRRGDSTIGSIAARRWRERHAPTCAGSRDTAR